MAFDKKFYPFSMWDKKSLYLKIETGYAYTSDMNNELVKNFNPQKFT